jgi:hypothetical protein
MARVWSPTWVVSKRLRWVARIRATLVELGAGESGNLCLQQLLKAASLDLRDQGASGGALHELAQLGCVIIGEGMLCVRFLCSAQNRVTDRPTLFHN